MTNIDILRKELNKEEYSLTLASRVRRAGGLDGMSEKVAADLVKSFGLEPKEADADELAYKEYKKAMSGLDFWLKERADIGEATIFEAWGYDASGDAEMLERCKKEIADHKERLESLYESAKRYADWLRMPIDTRWKRV